VAFFTRIYFLNKIIANYEHRSSSLEESQTSHTNIFVAEESQETQIPSRSGLLAQTVQQCHQAILRKVTKATAGRRDHDKIQ
jgi:hypothetical protein